MSAQSWAFTYMKTKIIAQNLNCIYNAASTPMTDSVQWYKTKIFSQISFIWLFLTISYDFHRSSSSKWNWKVAKHSRCRTTWTFKNLNEVLKFNGIFKVHHIWFLKKTTVMWPTSLRIQDLNHLIMYHFQW